MIYKRKYLYSCEHADKVLAISEQTKSDLINDLKEKLTEGDIVLTSGAGNVWEYGEKLGNQL